MMPCKYQTILGGSATIDLDSVFDIVSGYSQRRLGWSALIVYEPLSNVFVELCSEPQDYRGNSATEEQEVDEAHIQTVYGLTATQLSNIKKRPNEWKLIQR
tara:strand:+ start:611 stop:913 length:303 start_codon:yes stop_codon:yes gene_type:complete